MLVADIAILKKHLSDRMLFHIMVISIESNLFSGDRVLQKKTVLLLIRHGKLPKPFVITSYQVLIVT